MVLLSHGRYETCCDTCELDTFGHTYSVNSHSPVVFIHAKSRRALWPVTVGSALGCPRCSLRRELTMGCSCFDCVSAWFAAIPD
ncbi:hypothetical protein FCV25MIE_00774 [Fagus crenata]